MPMCRRPESETDADEEKACAGLVRVVAISVSASMVSAAAEDDCRRDGQAIIVLLCPCVRASVLWCRAEPLKSIPPKIRTGILI